MKFLLTNCYNKYGFDIASILKYLLSFHTKSLDKFLIRKLNFFYKYLHLSRLKEVSDYLSNCAIEEWKYIHKSCFGNRKEKEKATYKKNCKHKIIRKKK